MTLEKENNKECDNDASVEDQSDNLSPIGPYPLRYHPLTQKIKGVLVRFPRVYSLIVRVYMLAVGAYVLSVRLYDWVRSRLEYRSRWLSFVSGPSRQHISASQGLVQITAMEAGNWVKPLPSFEAHYETRQNFTGCTTDIKAIAYHLPQFHAIPENNAWWGEGFTEWHNTRKAKPSFPGHYQPREPHDDIGYYDLSDVEVLRRQVDMAKQYGIYGFCFYHYWFHGKRLLGKPVDLLLENTDLDMPFCLCWANETWSRKWDGKNRQVLIKQTFSPEDDIRFIEFLAPYFRDPRYIRINNKPLLLVYQVSMLPKPIKTVKRWRTWCRENGIGELHLVAVCHGEVYPHVPLEKIGFDAYAAFPPHSFPCQHITEDDGLFDGGYRFNYVSGIDSSELSHTDTRIYEGCMLGWDNTARFGKKGVTMFPNFSIQKYYTWLRRVIDYTRANFPEEERLVFLNAWNEWAEGTSLEPDKRYGYVYLNTTARALFNFPQSDPAASGDSPDQDSAE